MFQLLDSFGLPVDYAVNRVRWWNHLVDNCLFNLKSIRRRAPFHTGRCGTYDHHQRDGSSGRYRGLWSRVANADSSVQNAC